MVSVAVLDSLAVIGNSQQYETALGFSRSISIEPDPWQYGMLTSLKKRIQVCCSRQSGKTTTTGILAAAKALSQRESQTIILAPGRPQGEILMRKVKWAMRLARWPLQTVIDNSYELILSNGAGVKVLPGNEETARGPSGIDLLLVEEASLVEDELYHAVRPALAAKPDAMEIQLGTPHGNRGFFYEQNRRIKEGNAPEWEYFEVPAEECPRISPAFLEEERRIKGFWWFEQEYHCVFLDAQSSAFPRKFVDQALKEVDLWAL